MQEKNRLHWTTVMTEKGMLSVALVECNHIMDLKIELADLFLLFIYTEIVGMVGAYFISNRIPVTLPIIIAMTALCRLIVLHSKDANPWVLVAEAGAILILAGAAYVMSQKDKLSLEKRAIREKGSNTNTE